MNQDRTKYESAEPPDWRLREINKHSDRRMLRAGLVTPPKQPFTPSHHIQTTTLHLLLFSSTDFLKTIQHSKFD